MQMLVHVVGSTERLLLGADVSAPDIALNNQSGRRLADVAPHTLLADARRLLRDALPPEAASETAPLAAVMHLNVEEDDVLAALHVFARLPLPAAARRPRFEPISVDVASHWLSVAGVMTLLQEGAIRAADRPLHTGRYWCATVKTGDETAARFWFPERLEAAGQ